VDYLEMARKALEVRQFLEAENYLSKYNSATDEQSDDYYEVKFNLSLQLANTSLNEDFSNYLCRLNLQKQYTKIIELITQQVSSTKLPKQSYLYHYLVESLFQSGKQAEAASTAREHIEFLVSKKLYHHWQMEIERYQSYFKNYLFFQVMALQLLVATDDITSADKKWHEIVGLVEKKFNKLEDTKDVEKRELIARCNELMSQIEVNGIDASLLSHKSHLILKKYETSTMASGDWKKLVELVVYEASWFHLKLVLDLSLDRSEEVFTETLRLMKKKKGFNLIKLTRFDKKLKDRLIGKRAVSIPEEASGLSADDLRLEEPKYVKDIINTIADESEELRSVEDDMIKNIAFQEMDEKSILDLITTFIQFDFFRVAKFLIKRSKEIQLTKLNHRKIDYLKIIVSTRMGDYHLALAELSELIGQEDVQLDEYTELRYLEAALFEQVGDIEKALRSYHEVKKVDPDYRRLKERMQKIA
jgi:hypothetical protein